MRGILKRIRNRATGLGRSGFRPLTKFPAFDLPISQLVTGEQIRHPEFDRWRMRLGMRHGLNRKLWEYVYIARALEVYLSFASRPKILGFGVGMERLPAALAAAGCEILATDYAESSEAVNPDWSARGLSDLLTPRDGDWDESLRHKPICDPDVFARSVRFEAVDMTRIPAHLAGFDGLWSCGSLEHIGGLQAGRDFILRSLKCLRPGGVAVHTTEYNLSSNERTHEDPHLCFYRRRDIIELVRELNRAGHRVELTLERENSPENNDVDRAPFHYDFTMNAQHGLYVITSIGLIITKRVN